MLFYPYEELGLTRYPQPTARQISAAYKTLQRQYHPNTNVGEVDENAKAEKVSVFRGYGASIW
jgi:curved DNA-binding protein CbpA